MKKTQLWVAAYAIVFYVVAGSHDLRAQYYGNTPSQLAPISSEPMDEAMKAGRKVEDFYAEKRDVFHFMDQITDKDGNLHPVSLDPSVEADQNFIKGRNTWLLWCAGNEGFWNWLAQDGYGLLDYLRLLDSRQRSRRFKDLGLVNQPGMVANEEPGPWGLYIDRLVEPLKTGDPNEVYPEYPPLQDQHGRKLVSDGVNPSVYGYPSGVIGFRIFPNPAFDEEAKQRWNAEAFYDDPDYSLDPKIVRPFRVGMSCALCHVAAHPLNPPEDPEAPKWENLSAIIGNQYFRTSAVLCSQVPRGNFLWHYLASQQPGTVDTSMTCTDHINNSNAMNGVFNVPARMARAMVNPAEEQADVSQSLPTPLNEGKNPRRTPRVLMEGADSVGVWGALARVYLNIGMYWEEWNAVNNTIIGVKPQRPFQIAVSRSNSIYWQVNEKFRINYLAAYFLHHNQDKDEMATQPMLLKHALVKEDEEMHKFSDSTLAEQHLNPTLVGPGRAVFAQHCMICHSSKQPSGFHIQFAHKAPGGGVWSDAPSNSDKLVLPYAWENWEAFKKSPAYQVYAARAVELSQEPDFLDDNYLSTELRIPVSLVGTNSARAMATNALAGEVWADYSSETYKQLPAVGDITYHNPFNRKEESYRPKAGGRGYYRPPSLISVWATAPLLHGNTLGYYIPDGQAAHRVSVQGRLEMFDDAMGKLLWKDRRGTTPSGEEGLRDPGYATWRGTDPGWIYRTDKETYAYLPRLHIRHAAETLVPSFFLFFVDWPWVAPLLLALLTGLAMHFSRRAVFYLALVAGLSVLVGLLISGIIYLLPGWWIWLALLLLVGSVVSLIYYKKRVPADAEPAPDQSQLGFYRQVAPWVAPAALGLLSLAIWDAGADAKRLLDGETEFRLGPIPQGTPINGILNLDPQASVGELLAVSRGLLKSIDKIKKRELKGDEALEVFNKYAGQALVRASKCPDYVLDRGHYFGESLTDNEKKQLIAFLKTL